MKKDEDVALLGAINKAEENSYGSDSDSGLSSERAYNIDMYLGRNTMPAPDGRSQVVDRSVYETVQAMCPSLARIFASGDDVVELPPIGREDEQGAKQESQYLNYLVLQKNNWFQIFDTACKDALLTKAGYLYPYLEKRRQVELERYERQTPESLALIMQDQPEIVEQREYPDPEYVAPPPQPLIDPMTVQPVMGPQGPVMQPPPPAPMLYDIAIRRTKVEPSFCIDVLPPERCKIAESTKTVQLDRCAYFEYFDYPTISDLRADGYDVPDDIGMDDPGTALEETARDQYSENQTQDNAVADPSMRQVKTRWVWIRYDYDGDGIAELQYCVVVGQNVLHREEVNRIPVAVICPDPLPHRHVGLCPADSVADIAQIKTVILRQGLDNLQLSNNPQKFIVPGMVNLDDALVTRPGSIIRGKQGAIFGQHIAPFVVPNVFPQAMEGLGYMDQVKEGRTGVSNYFTGLDQNALNKTATGIQQLSTMAAQRVEQIARHISNGITELFAILHELVLKAGHKAETVKLRGQWVEIDPSTWRRRNDFKISVGYAAGNKDNLVARLMMMANMQEKAAAGGLSIVNERNMYETAIELTKASDFSAPERFWTDPSQAQPKGPPQPDVTVMAMESLKAQSAQTIKAAELASDEKLKAAELHSERQNAELEAQTKLTIAQMQAQHAAELEQVRGQHAERQEHVRAHLNPKTKEAESKATEVKQKGDAFQALMDRLEKSDKSQSEMMGKLLESVSALSGPKKIVRGKDGKVSHVVPA